jgi:hypothetical protein
VKDDESDNDFEALTLRLEVSDPVMELEIELVRVVEKVVEIDMETDVPEKDKLEV